MLPKVERFSTTELSNLKNIKSTKTNCPLGFFVIFPTATTRKKGIMVSKKVFKTAVIRNKNKRLFYNTVNSLESLKNKSFIFHPKKTYTKKELLEELSKM